MRLLIIICTIIMLLFSSAALADVTDSSNYNKEIENDEETEKIPITGLDGYYITELSSGESKDSLIIVNEAGEQASTRAYKYISSEVGLGGTIEVASNYSDNEDINISTEEEYDFKGLINTEFKEILPCNYYRFIIREINDIVIIVVPELGGVKYFDIHGKSIDNTDIYNFVDIEDINCSDWAKDSIREAILRGIVPEKLQNDYSRSITREEFCDLVMKLYIQMYDYFKSEKAEIVYEKVLKSKPFVDCNSENVALAEYLGIVKGVGNDEFYPDKSISRQEAAVMLYNLTDCLFEFTNNKIEPRTIAFDDEDEFSEWAKESIYFVCGEREFGSESLMWGTGDNKFMPLSDFTVEQAISTMYRIINT